MEGAPDKQKKKGLTRRQVLHGGLFAIGASYTYLKCGEGDISLEGFEEKYDFLTNPDSHHTLVIGSEQLNRSAFLRLASALIQRQFKKGIPEEVLSSMVSQFGEMVRVEYQFMGYLNKVDHINHSDTLGYAQVHFGTAFNRANEHRALLSDIYDIPDEIDRGEIIRDLDLQKDGSILFGFLEFARSYAYYGQTEEGAIRHDDARVESLVCAAYSGSYSGPRVAKLQTYIHELLVADSDFKAYCKAAGSTSIAIDGAKGAETQKFLELLNSYDPYGGEVVPNDIMDQEESSGGELNKLNEIWKTKRDELFTGERNVATILTELVPHRHSSVFGTFATVESMIPEGHSGAAAFEDEKQAFIDSRDMTLFVSLADPTICKEKYGIDQTELWTRLKPVLLERIRVDGQYKGYVPTAFSESAFLGDDSNIMKRVVMYHQKPKRD